MRAIVERIVATASPMRRLTGALAAGVVAAACAGCASHVVNNENLLSGAGFKVMLATDPHYAAAAAQLPPHRFAHHVANGVTTYYYLDPTICGCLYYGGEQNWAAYRQETAEQLHMQAEEFLEKANTPYSGQGGI